MLRTGVGLPTVDVGSTIQNSHLVRVADVLDVVDEPYSPPSRHPNRLHDPQVPAFNCRDSQQQRREGFDGFSS